MDRRGFVRTTFLGGLAAGGTACATSGPDANRTELPLDNDELDAKLAQLDRSMARIHSRTSREWFLRQRDVEQPTPEEQEDFLEDGDIVQSSIRSALLVSSIAELPEANRSDPRVLERLATHSDEADFAVFGSLARFRALKQAELEELDQMFAATPDLGSRVVEDIDELASSLGVARSRRLHLRSMANHLSWRLERERFSSVLQDTMTKVEDMLDMLVRQLGPEPAVAGGDPAWMEKTRAVIARYEPAPGGETVPIEDYEKLQAELAEKEAAEANRIAEERKQAEAKLAKEKRIRNILLGVGVGALVLGAAVQFAWVLGPLGLAITGAVVATSGIILLIVSIVFAVRVRRQRKALGQ
jgi:hypothetical protein